MKKKQIGNIKSIELDITKPLQMTTQEMTMGQIMILVGTNGTGKTFILKMIWALTTQVMHYVHSRSSKIPFDINLNMQFLLDNTFTDNNITGTISIYYELYSSLMTVVCEEGKVISCKITVDEDVEAGTQPVFMSKETRLMSDIIQYIKVKKMIGLAPGMVTNETDFKKLLEMYRIYDIILIEQLLLGIEHKTTPDFIKKFNDRMKTFDEEFSIQDIKVDYVKSDIIYTDDKGVESSTARLGAGHQSLMSMILVQEYQNT